MLAPHVPSGIAWARLGLLALPWPGTSLGMPEREGHMEPPGDTLRTSVRPQGYSPVPGVVPCACSPCPAPHACTTFLLPVPFSLCLLPVPAPRATPALLPWLGGTGAVGQGAAGLVGTMVRSVCAPWGTVGVLWGDKGCGCLCHVCAMGWGPEVQPGAWPGCLGPVWGHRAGTEGWVCRGGSCWSQCRAGAQGGDGQRGCRASQPLPPQLQDIRQGSYLLFLFLQNCTKRGFFLLGCFFVFFF